MAAPVEVGAQGTVGSLVLREVEYFRRMEVAGGHGHGKKISSSKVVAASGGSSPAARSNSSKPKAKKKKNGAAVGNGSFLPRMCSSAEVAEDPGSGGRRERPSRVRYRPLGDDDGDALMHQQDY